MDFTDVAILDIQPEIDFSTLGMHPGCFLATSEYAMRIPSAETIRVSAIAHLRELGADTEADLLSGSTLEVGDTVQEYIGSTTVGLNITLRCKATDLSKFVEDGVFGLHSSTHMIIQDAVEAVLPAEFKVNEFRARSMLVDRNELEKTEIERLVEAQIDLMIAVATGGPRIQSKNDEYKQRRLLIRQKLESLGKHDPNPFEDLWHWYGRWSSGDLPRYQSRRDYVKGMYRELLEELAGTKSPNPSEPRHEPTGWEKVDRVVDKIVAALGRAKDEEEYQSLGLLCRECLISLAQAVFNPAKHKSEDGTEPSQTDAYRMLEAYFSAELPGAENDALRRHAKASLALANHLQHKRTAKYLDAALCAEATRTIVNIVAITSGKH